MCLVFLYKVESPFQVISSLGAFRWAYIRQRSVPQPNTTYQATSARYDTAKIQTIGVRPHNYSVMVWWNLNPITCFSSKAYPCCDGGKGRERNHWTSSLFSDNGNKLGILFQNCVSSKGCIGIPYDLSLSFKSIHTGDPSGFSHTPWSKKDFFFMGSESY